MNVSRECGIQVSRTQPTAPAGGVTRLARLRDWATTALRRRRERQRLREDLTRLDSRLLRDIGVSRETLWREACKPFWRE